ncbi:MAG TPA: Zn-ribbon domain-containing OB-fold protein [Dehalococcoidia bacterium]|jgi:hypothetical protein|nr:Zn-ribbon domain-containing OB-fold protein [Dehalococcoidia bacterium]
MADKPFSHAYFEEYLKEKKLMAARCRHCGRLHLPPRPMCLDCRRLDMEWVQLKGRGKLAAFTCIAVGPTFMGQQGFGRDNPYCTGIVELEEGPRISAHILGVDAQHPETIQIGTPMIMDPVEWQEKTFLAFRPA